MNEALERLVREEVEALGHDLVELRVRGTRTRKVFEVRVDRRDESRITVDDCARISRALEARLERDAVSADARYVLEVSSPGLDRPLTRAADWRRFVGRKAMVKSAALGGRVEIEIGSVEGPAGSEVVVVRDAAGVEHRLALAQVDEARLSVHWS